MCITSQGGCGARPRVLLASRAGTRQVARGGGTLQPGDAGFGGARKLAGEHPETVAPEKRQDIVDQLKAAVASFRHSLELQPENTRARRDIELVRQWIKYYGDKWQAYDREKRRREMNLIAFLEFLIETQRALRESVTALPGTATADAFAELKRVQDELQEEILPLKEKIKTELRPAQGGAGAWHRAGRRSWRRELRSCRGGRMPRGRKCGRRGASFCRG